MIEFPSKTRVHRRLPKEKFYQYIAFTKNIRDRIVSDVEDIFVEYSLTKSGLNLATDSDVQEIMLLAITLKKREVDERIFETIARQNPHKLVFQLSFEDRHQLAVYYGKLYRTTWTSEAVLSIAGESMTEVWHELVAQIALSEASVRERRELSLDERLALQTEILTLEKKITQLETAVWRESQPKKKFELHTQWQTACEQLEKLKHGENRHL